MRLAVTGAGGFLGWHARCALKARGTADVVPIDRALFADSANLQAALQGVDAVLHLAGVNRAEDAHLLDDNTHLAQRLTDALDAIRSRPVIVFANSIQSGSQSRFGETKQAAADHLVEWGRRSSAPVADVRLPNVFGEHGRPHYNSVVATFCHQLAHGAKPTILDDREIQLLHAQDAVDRILELIDSPKSGVFSPVGRPMKVSAILEKLRSFRDVYATGEIPNLVDQFDRSLFNTYRSFCFPDHYPIFPELHSDNRGGLFECLQSRGGQSQVFCSTTFAGVIRGNHFHLRKIERFLVLDGIGEIALRRLLTGEVVRFKVSGEQPAIVDMPTMWTHSITNVGTEDLLTMFWADQILNSEKPDTYAEQVEVVGAPA